MISLNDVLLAMSNIPVDDPIAEIWGRGLQSGYKIIEYTGTLPVTITANGDALIDYRIYGSNDGCGERTENFFDESTVTKNYYIDVYGRPSMTNGAGYSDLISVAYNETYSVIFDTLTYASGVWTLRVHAYDENGTWIQQIHASTYRGVEHVSIPITIDDQTIKYIRISGFMTHMKNIMFVRDTNDIAYQPYGYKLPMIVNNGITNIVPSAPAETKTSNGITVTSDGKGTYTISGTATTNASIGFNFDHSISCESKNTAALFNDFTASGVLFCYVGQTGVFSLGSLNRVLYDVAPIANKNLRGIAFYISSGTTINGTISPLIFDGVNVMPTEFVPYVPSVSYDVPVYIGEDQLDAGEYVSYGEQKIYRDVGGTLTPTDPPVPLPSIPTIDGTTVIDYDGDPKPSQMYIKYKGKG